MEALITGGSSFVGQCLEINGHRPTHKELDLTDLDSLKRYHWDGDTIIHCAHSGRYGSSTVDDFEKNLKMFANLRVRWPKAKLIAFGSGAMHDHSKPIVHASEHEVTYPKDYYGLSKRTTLNLADITLIPFGIYGDTRFVQAVRGKNEAIIYQDMLYSWVNVSDLTKAILWTRDKQGPFNLCAFDMTLTEVAKHEGVKKITYLQEGMGEYTGRRSAVPLIRWPKD